MTPYPRSAHPREDHIFATSGKAMISTSHPLATQAALDMLERGGSAADAYVAAAAVQVVVESPMTTFAGNLNMNWFDGASGGTTMTMGAPVAPKAEAGDWDEAGADSGRTAAVPGWLNGARIAWQQFGRLPWSDLFEHAHQHAQEGFVIDPHLWGWVWEYRYKMARFAEGQRLWYPNGSLLTPGELLRQPDLAATIEHIRNDESLEWFYRGDFARAFVARLREHGSRITLEEMAQQCGAGGAIPVAPLGRYRGHDIHSPGGLLYSLALQAAEYGDLGSFGRPRDNPESLYLEMRLVEEIWHFGLELPGSMLDIISDPAAAANFVNPEVAAALWERVLNNPSRPYDPMHPGTNALVIADRQGNVAFGTHSCTSHPFGNGHIVAGVWIPSPVMLWGKPARLPLGLSSGLLLSRDGKASFAAGSPSVSMLNNVLQNTLNVHEFGISLRDSVEQPMFGAAWYPSRRAMIEGNFPDGAYAHLDQRGMGYKRVSPQDCELGSCHAIQIDHEHEIIQGVADPRRRGQAAGL